MSEDSKKYEYKIIDDSKRIAVIYLNENLLGGDDALAFSTALNDISNKNILYLVVSLKDVKIINSSGLGMIASGLSTLKKHDIKMVLAEVPEKINKLFEMTHLNKVIEIHKDLDSALSHA